MTKRNKTQTLLWNNAGFNFGWDGNAHLELGFTLQVISGIQSWTGSLSLTRSWPWLGQGYTRTDKKLRSSSQSLLAAFHTAMTTQHFGYNFQDKTDRLLETPRTKCFALPTSFTLGCLFPSEEAASAATPGGFTNACLIPLHCTALQVPAGRSGLKVCSLHLSQLSCWRRGTDTKLQK